MSIKAEVDIEARFRASLEHLDRDLLIENYVSTCRLANAAQDAHFALRQNAKSVLNLLSGNKPQAAKIMLSKMLNAADVMPADVMAIGLAEFENINIAHEQ